MKNYKSAFTLAEVLITLGIIGVVAAITLPTLINKYQAKVLRTKFLQANAIIHDGMQQAYLEGADIQEIMAKRDANKLFKYFKPGQCKLPKNETEAKYLNYFGNRYAGPAEANDLVYPYCLANGMVLWLGVLNNINYEELVWYDSGTSILAIDINGWNKKPDTYGKDVFFWFYNSSNGKLIPSGIRHSQMPVTDQFYLHCPGTTSESEAGIGCTASALADKDYFNKLHFSH